MDNRILIVDDEEAIIRTVSLLLSKEGYDCRSATSLQAAKRECAQHEFDLGIVDLHLREDDGRDVLRYLRGLDAGIECIILTAFGTIGSAVECMRDGAIDYLAKPVDPTELVLRVRKALEHRSLTGEVERLRMRLGTRDRLSELVAESRAMQQIVELIERIRGQDIPVLITGETGTGKEIVARAVHATSRRAEKPFIAINCNTLPEDLLDSELFGHLKGAYTGAVSGGKGLFQQAHRGTLFLDEIGDVSLRLQSKLLRVLQEGEVRPVGGTFPEKVDVRIIAATNQDLESLVANGEFRADLYFRLNVLPIHIPPLRQRIEDVPALIDNFLLRLRTHQGRPDLDLTAAARAKLMDYDYPGNARELENILKRAFALSSAAQADADDIVFNRVGANAGVAADPDNASLPLEDMILRHIRRVLALHNGNQVAAARALGISRSTLRRKLGQSS